MRKRFSLLNLSQRKELLKQLSLDFPNPKSELVFSSVYELLCAVVLSAQTTDESVNRVTPTLFSLARTPEQMAELGEDKICQIIKSIGLYRAKAGYLIKLSRILVKEYDSQVPSDYESLVKLPGVGSKTAKVVLNVAFGQPTVAVDTHIFRVANRTGFCIGKNAKEVEERIVPLIDETYLIKAHHLLLLHGRYVCRAKNPMCDACSVRQICKKRLD
ncbi:MAG: endonuclease III [Succinivibrio sp.]